MVAKTVMTETMNGGGPAVGEISMKLPDQVIPRFESADVGPGGGGAAVLRQFDKSRQPIRSSFPVVIRHHRLDLIHTYSSQQ